MPSTFFSQAEMAQKTKPENHQYNRDWFESDGRPIYIYGSGHIGQQLFRYLSTLPKIFGRVAGFLDSDPGRSGQAVAGLPLLWVHDPVVSNVRPLVILAVNSAAGLRDMESRCNAVGMACLRFGLVESMNNPALDIMTIENNPLAISLMDMWADEKSRAVYRMLIRTRMLREYDSVVCDPSTEQYFPEFIAPRHYRSFVDGGAYTGDTIDEYQRRFSYDFDNYYAFEADSQNYRKLVERHGNDDARFRFYEYALFNRKSELPFSQNPNGISSTVASTGSVTVEAAALDDILDGLPVTFIKMDIEGSEPMALEGCQKILSTQFPALAISVYHQDDHIWKIPHWIKKTIPKYRIYLRHYTMCLSETICYAVAAE